MPQETNLNVSPYFDDFNVDDNYYKVLFKPGYPVQARELTSIQSILQNQIEQFGNHIFKEGSVVIPGQLSLDNPFHAVEIEPTFNNIPISAYFDEILDKRIRGSLSGVSAKVVYVLDRKLSERDNYTLYVQYLESGGSEFENKVFLDGESLITENNITYSGITIQSGQEICSTIASNATSDGSAVNIASGVYFVRGIFAKVDQQRILLEQYNTTPSYKVGFNIIERIVTALEDEDLYDNSQGFSNYAAPGADRFRIELELKKYSLDETPDNFVEILRIVNGSPQFFEKNAQYSLIRDELARRTAETNGDYYVKPFTLFVRDSLNDRTLTNGIYFDNQKTVNGNTPSEDVMVYEIGPGKAYVSGYDVEIISPRLLEVPKTRTTNTLEQQVIPYNAGQLVALNNVYGAPYIGLGTDTTIDLMDSRLGVNESVAAGTTIGVARVYDYVPESSYINDTSIVDIRLFDIQTFTKITLTNAITQSVPAFIKGKRSNASGYLRQSITSSTELVLYQVSGKFSENEPISINGIDNGRLINNVVDYSTSDIKSMYSKVGVSTFNADLILENRIYLAPSGTQFNITAASGGISTVSAGINVDFVNSIKSGDIISYSNPSGNDVIYNKVQTISVGGRSFTIAGITTVPGICEGRLPTSNETVTNLVKLTSSIYSEDSSLLTKLNRSNISSISLDGSEIKQRRVFPNQTITAGTIALIITDEDVFFDSFDEDKFLISYSDGSIEPLRRDKFSIIDSSGKQIQFSGLTKSSGNATVIATVRNIKPNSKNKKLNKANTLLITNSKLPSSGIGTTTLNDGLTYSQVYGTRVQDEEISLNISDAVRVLAVYESSGSEDPQLPRLQFNSFSGPTNSNQDLFIGEQIVGQTSGAVGLIVNLVGVDQVEYVYLNTFKFADDEVILSKESNVQALITEKTLGDSNITQNFSFDNGQRETILDYSRIIRKKNVIEPSRKIKVVFQNYTIDSSDTGEFVSVNSYQVENFKHDVPYFNNARLTDYIDLRPRVAPYTPSSRSPFEFNSRNFSADGQYSSYILAPEENLILTYSYYLPRIDVVFLNQDGTFEVVQGTPAEVPQLPAFKANAFDIAVVNIPPYVYDIKNILVNMSVHKRYRMDDISLLEDRISRVEEFTVLSALENKTENFIIKDAETGLDRFKSGFFVDDFKSHAYHDLQNVSFKAAIDKEKKMLRPLHYTTSLDLQLGSEAISGVGQIFNPNADQSYITDLGSIGVKKTGDLITLDYDEIVYDQQLLATKTESVTAFLVRYWSGLLNLNPPIDTWVDEKAITTNSFNEVKTTDNPLPDINITAVNNVNENQVVFRNPPNSQGGIQPFDWLENARRRIAAGGTYATAGFRDSRRALVIGQNFRGENRTLEIINGNTIRIDGLHWTRGDAALLQQYVPADVANQFLTRMIDDIGWANRANGMGGFLQFTPPQTTETRQTSTSTRSTSNTVTTVTPERIIETESKSSSNSHYTEPVRYLRSRNIEFDAKGLKPRTKFYAFFQGVNIDNYITPKILEIEMISGRFRVGETVISDPTFTNQKISFRLCTPNHKTGSFNAPIETFELNPYTQQPFERSYSETSSVLNVDTRGLELPSEVDFYGQVVSNMRLIGRSSRAVARVKAIRLLSDNGGRLIGSFYVPDPNIVGNPKWINGENNFTVIDTASLDQIQLVEFIPNSRINESSAEAEFTSSAITNITETNILTTRNIRIIPPRNINTTTITNITTNTTTVSQNVTPSSVQIQQPYDPLAQSFYVFEDTGIFLTSVDVYFETRDSDNIPVTLQIRPLLAGVPSNVVVPFSEVTLIPDQIQLSIDGTVPTKFTFPSPVYLQGPQQQTVRQAPIASQTQAEYAIVLISNSPNYRVFVTELGQNDILSGVKISKQPTLGSMFKSQNGTVWTPSQLEDLKYKIYRADFKPEGLVKFFNPPLSIGNKKVTVTGPNQFEFLSKRIVVGLGSTGYSSNVAAGVTITQGAASGTLIGIAGSVSTTTISNSGIGYTNGTFNNVQLVTETGFGQGAVATIGVASSVINSVTITNGGIGYQVGDSLIIPPLGQGVGINGKLTVSAVNSLNTFVLDEVQGTFTVGITTVDYIDSSGITTSIGPGVTISSIIEDQYYDGLHIKVYQQNHSMHSYENYVQISEFRPLNTEANTRTTSEITVNETTNIPVESTSGFNLFEGIAVTPVDPGYAIIGEEVIRYTGVTATSLTGITRGIDGTQAIPYRNRTFVYKYEFNGVSLRRINKVHNSAEVDSSNTGVFPIDLNSYFIKIDNSATDFENTPIGRNRTNDLYFKRNIQGGQSGVVISNNIQYESIDPNIANIIPAKTNIVSRIRTFTGTSIGGNEKSFVDRGFESIPLDTQTYFNEPKLICSRINEERFITESPGNRSLTIELLMTTSDSRVSPVIDTISAAVTLSSNLINNPNGIGNQSTYATDTGVRSRNNDDHATIYISKVTKLKIPANSLKVILSASRNNLNDVRVLYQIFREDESNTIPSFELFPGYSNYQVDGVGIKRVIDSSKNDGSSDSFVEENSDRGFKDYEYSVDDLPDFTAFAIKIVMASSNQATPPLIRDLRTIATVKPKI
jgi:hypothetical protein